MSRWTREGVSEDGLSMKPLLSVAVQEAFKLAVADVTMFEHMDRWDKKNPCPEDDAGDWMERRAAERERYAYMIQHDVFQVDQNDWNGIDPMALAQNLSCRLLGTGGWQLGQLYTGNASPGEVLAASVARRDSTHVDDLAAQLGEAGFETFDPTRDDGSGVDGEG